MFTKASKSSSKSSSASSSSMMLKGGAASVTSSSITLNGFSCKLPLLRYFICACSKALPSEDLLPS